MPLSEADIEVLSEAEAEEIMAGGRRRAPLLVAILLGVAAVAVLGWLVLAGGEGDRQAATPDAGPDLAVAALAEPDAPPVEAAEPPDAAPAPGRLRVTSRPRNARLFLDDTPLEETTPTTLDGLAPGTYRLRVEAPRHQSREVEVKVLSGKLARADVRLVRERPAGDRREGSDKGGGTAPPPPPAGAGELRIASTPSCEVIIDGKLRGSTPLAGIELSAGKHKVKLVNSRYGIDETYTVDIAPGEVTKKKYTFPVPPK